MRPKPSPDDPQSAPWTPKDLSGTLKKPESKYTEKTDEDLEAKAANGHRGGGCVLSEGRLDLEGLAAWMHVKT